MKLTLVLLSIFSTLPASIAYTCTGNDCGCIGSAWDDFCCVGGTFVGPVVDALHSSLSAEKLSLSAEQSSLAASLQADESSRLAAQSSRTAGPGDGGSDDGSPEGPLTTQDGDDFGSLRRRAATVTVVMSSGLTCIGASAAKITGAVRTDGTYSTGSTLATKPSSGIAAMITLGPILAFGAAAIAYGAM